MVATRSAFWKPCSNAELAYALIWSSCLLVGCTQSQDLSCFLSGLGRDGETIVRRAKSTPSILEHHPAPAQIPQNHVQGRAVQLMEILASPGLSFLGTLIPISVCWTFQLSEDGGLQVATGTQVLFAVAPPLPYVAPCKCLLHPLSLLTSERSVELPTPFPNVFDVFRFLKMRLRCLCSGVTFQTLSISPSLNVLLFLFLLPDASIGISPHCCLSFILNSCHVQVGSI